MAVTAFAAGVICVASFLTLRLYQLVYGVIKARWILAVQNIPVADSNPGPKAVQKRRRGPSFLDQALHQLGVYLSKKHGGIIRVHFGPWNIVQVNDPFIMAEIWDRNKYPQLIDKPRGFPFLVYSALDMITTPPSPNLLTTATSDPHWKVIRKQLAPAFSALAVKRDAWPITAEMGNRAVKALQDMRAETPVDMAHLLQCYALDVIGKFAFDRDFGAVSSSKSEGAYMALCIRESANFIVECGKYCLTGPLRPYFIKDYQKKVEQKKFMEANLQSLMKEVVGRGSGSFAPGSVARILLENREALGQNRFFAELSIMFLAGMETTGNTMAWALYNISMRPEILAGVEAELDSLGLLKTKARPNNRDIDYDDLNKLVYLNACIKESQRFHPTAPMLFRQAMQDVKIGRYLIPKGTLLLLHLMAMYQSDDNFDNASEFLPERWYADDADIARHCGEKPEPGSQVRRFVPFGDGCRKCIGGELGRVSLIATLARLFSNFRFRLADQMGGPDGVMATEAWAATLHARNGLYMHAIPR